MQSGQPVLDRPARFGGVASSVSMAKNTGRLDDPRILRTRKLLEEALLGLGAVKPFAAISVADVVTAAGVSRSTFYDHFSDVEELLFQTLQEGVQIEHAQANASESFRRDAPPVELLDFLRHVERHRSLYRSALGKQGSTTFFHVLRERIELDLHRDFGQIAFPAALPEPIATAAVSGIVLGILMQWIENDPLTDSAAVADWIWRAIPRSGDHQLQV